MILLMLACGSTESHLDEVILHAAGGDAFEVTIMPNSYAGLGARACGWSKRAEVTVDGVVLDRDTEHLNCGGLRWFLDDPSVLDAPSPQLSIDGAPVMELGPILQQVQVLPQGALTQGQAATVTVSGSIEIPDVYYVQAADGSEVPFEQVGDAVTFTMPDQATLFLSSGGEATCEAVYCSAAASWQRTVVAD